ncbi:Type cbb3 cytochrome oxidase biogenesis protein CcoS, involved in heme b insertion [Marinobacterium lacunae]|uniref:Type cbb3 cytochrome oxidase biogenesis protein CcoS, involved in heme b insertion n=1 Tax=Marinobacterium lacunae TaxID=1232683 RepID=A0A081FW76_9GAMM|nr:cbb3-type cytochrome oxidase assembly protein CcoS [Marinobacterium lacunae]KEA62781.1 Type cbb3 cytochrome oxidase biogenesis protein CcoS, involved in heme b insertion [Marinobacterium lacunae]
MSIVYLLIPIAIILASIAVWAFFWSVNSGQYDDLESPAHSILYDDDEDLIPQDAKAKPDEKPSQDSNANTHD